MLEAIGARRIFVYAMGLEPWFEPILGLAYTPEAPQIKEASRLLAESRRRRFEEARLLSGREEFYLPIRALKRHPTAADQAIGGEFGLSLAREQKSEMEEFSEPAISHDSEDQFIFDS